MNMFRIKTSRLALVLVLALLCGCASTSSSPTPAPTAKRNGFLSHYDQLKPLDDGDDAASSWRLANVDWKKYDKVFIERIQVFPKKESEDKGIDPTDLKMLVDYFYEALVREIKPTAQIVDTIGPNVLVLRIAIVDLVPTEYALSIAGTLTPYAFIAEAASGPASGRPAGSTPYLGESSVEVQFLDGESRQIVAEFTGTKIGKKYDVDTSKGTVNAAKKYMGSYTDSFTAWNYAKQGFDEWAALFISRFNELRNVKPKQ